MATSLALHSLPYPREYWGTNTPIPMPLRIECSSMPLTECGCWIWLRQINDNGYGLITIGGKTRAAHRVSYQTFRGPIPQGILVCHACDIPSCVNPDHLFLGTNADNMADMTRKGRGRPYRGGTPPLHPRLSYDDVFYIRNSGVPIQQIKNRYAVHISTLYDIRAGVTWASIPFINSPEVPAAPQPSPQVKPASEGVEAKTISDGAGTSQSPDAPAEQRVPSGEERPTPEPGASALHGSGGLPEGWEREYAKALGKATKPHSLSKYATAWWAPHGGWVAHKSGPNAGTSTAIYDAFANHFGDAGKEARETILHELNAQ